MNNKSILLPILLTNMILAHYSYGNEVTNKENVFVNTNDENNNLALGNHSKINLRGDTTIKVQLLELTLKYRLLMPPQLVIMQMQQQKDL